MFISLPEYAARHGKAPRSVRNLAERGRLKTAQKIGRNWAIDSDEPYPEDDRVHSGEKTIYTNLAELTGQGKGLVLYGVNRSGVSGNGAEMMILDWVGIEGTPRIGPLGMLLGMGEAMTVDDGDEVKDIGGYLKLTKPELIFDISNDYAALPGVRGKRYFVRTDKGEIFTVIAPTGWV
ncbi:MAG: hypothetical protein LBT32_03190 [Peptococcaceae bacterium]|jgi:hypothetical protein|nr:hypothetical protein [Peptococcaceae bacterium]